MPPPLPHRTLDKWQALLPTPSTSSSHPRLPPNIPNITTGNLPTELYESILGFLPVREFGRWGRCCRIFNVLLREEGEVWRGKLRVLGFRGEGEVQEEVEEEDEFGEFTALSLETVSDDDEEDDFGDFQHQGDHSFSNFGSPELSTTRDEDDLMMLFDDSEYPSYPLPSISRPPPPPPLKPLRSNHTTSPRSLYISHHLSLLPYYRSLRTHTTSSLLFTTPSLTPLTRAHLLSTLTRFLSPALNPDPTGLIKKNIESCKDFYESTLVAEFERNDRTGEEEGMKGVVEVVWALGEEGRGESLIQVYLGKREVMIEELAEGWDPLKNLVLSPTPLSPTPLLTGLDFSPMNNHLTSLLDLLTKTGSQIFRIFPPEAREGILVYFTERVCEEILSEYCERLLGEVQGAVGGGGGEGELLFLLATAATFGQCYRVVEGVLEVFKEGENNQEVITHSPSLSIPTTKGIQKLPTEKEKKSREKIEDIVFRMFENHMDDYLVEETEWIRKVLEGICEDWEIKSNSSNPLKTDPTFLSSQNPAQIKRNILTSFTKILLLPVTIIPKTATMGLNALTVGATGVFDTFLGGLDGIGIGRRGGGGSGNGSSVNVVEDAGTVVGGGSGGEWNLEESTVPLPSPISPSPLPPSSKSLSQLQLLLSLDTSLLLIQSNRECLKRIQTFSRYPGVYGKKVKDAIEEVFIILLQVLSEKHIGRGFGKAMGEMERWRPGVEGEEEEGRVAPLVQFFELVHIGDTIQQMVGVYFDKEMAGYIDKKDFLNAVVREKKKFETALDDAVAQGLNAGINILMTQVEHIIFTHQGPKDFFPEEGLDLDLRPTKACTDAILVLKEHCGMLKGSTDKQILEVFNSEVGIRLHGILLKHLKKLTVSIEGGFQLISDLNAYHSFITSLKQPQVTAYFNSLKLVGEIFIVDSPKDLSHLVRDVSRYDGTLSTEDLYEIVQRRADWKRIEKEVERGLFGFKKEDCVIS